MKKIFEIVTCTIGFLLIILGSVMKVKENTAVSIIGGADGPTSVFLAGKLNSNLSIFLMLIGIILLATALVIRLKRKY